MAASPVRRGRGGAHGGCNAVGVYGFDLDVLQPVADRVGPTVAEIDLLLDQVPADSRSIAFAGENVKPW